MANEIGIIGQMYQNRKNKKVGVIESRNDKYKTLMMRDPDGNSFSIVYSTFKSDWRTYSGDEVAETSTQVEEKKEKVKKAEKKLEKPAKKEKISKEDKVEATGALYELVSSLVEKSNSGLSVKLNSIGGVNVKKGHKTICGTWVSDVPGIYSLYTNMEIEFSEKVGDVEFTHNDKWTLKNRHRMKNIKQAVNEVLQKYISDTKEEK